MSDLKSFTSPGLATSRVDWSDTHKGFWAALATMTWTGYSGVPTGAVRLDGAGGADRPIAQWNGSAYVGFKLVSSGGFKSDLYDTNQANIYFGASSGRWFANFAANTYFDYSQSSGALRYVDAGNERWQVTPARLTLINTRVDEPVGGTTLRNNGGSASVYAESFHEVQNENGIPITAQINVSRQNGSSALIQQLTRAGARNADRRETAMILDTGTNAGEARMIIGGITDDGVTGLQVRSLRAPSQPRIEIANDTNQTIGASTEATITLGAAFDDLGMTYTSVDSSINVDRAGTVLIIFRARLMATSGTPNPPIVSLKRNGSTQQFCRTCPVGSLANATELMIVFREKANAAGDKFSISITTDASSNITLGTKRTYANMLY